MTSRNGAQRVCNCAYLHTDCCSKRRYFTTRNSIIFIRKLIKLQLHPLRLNFRLCTAFAGYCSSLGFLVVKQLSLLVPLWLNLYFIRPQDWWRLLYNKQMYFYRIPNSIQTRIILHFCNGTESLKPTHCTHCETD